MRDQEQCDLYNDWQRNSQLPAQQAPPNRAPTVASAISDASIANESGTHTASLSGVFTDADGNSLTVTAASSDQAVATASVSSDGSSVMVTAKARGTATITATANDGNGGTASDSFIVTVKAAPRLAAPISDVTNLQTGTTRDIPLAGVFTDADGDSLTVTAASSDDATVAALASGGTLKLHPRKPGTATITLRAQDPDGNRVEHTFDATVASPPASPTSAPEDFECTWTGGQTGWVNCTWQPVDGATAGYVVEYEWSLDVRGRTSTYNGNSDVSRAQYSGSMGKYITTARYRVAAKTPDGTGPFTAWATVSP